MLAITGLLLLLAAALAVADWRRGLFVAVPVALLQDPLRKLTPGEPVFYIVLVGVVIAAAALTATVSGVSLMPNRIRGWRRHIGTPFGLFIAIVLLQAVHAYARFGNFIIPTIGLLVYLTPFVALGLVYQTVIRNPENFLTKFFQFYVVCTFLFLLSILPEYFGYRWSILGEVGTGIYIFDQHTIMTAYSGLFRASEIAAWHAATCVCLLIVLIVSRRMTLAKVIWTIMLVLITIGLGMLTGRRKFLVEIIVFASAYVTLLFYFGRGASRLALVSACIGLAGFLAVTLLLPEDKGVGRKLDAPYRLYIERGKSSLGDVPDRFTNLGLAPISWAYNRYGLLGAGLGAGSQGAQQFGAGEQGAAEGGLGKIWLELGALGFVMLAWLTWAIIGHVWALLKQLRRNSVLLSRMALGLTSFLIANVAAFIVATQAFGDIFILLMIGTALGALMAMPVLAERELQKRILGLTPNSSRFPVPHAA